MFLDNHVTQRSYKHMNEKARSKKGHKDILTNLDSLRLKTRSLINHSYVPTLPSTYVKKSKRNQITKPIPKKIEHPPNFGMINDEFITVYSKPINESNLSENALANNNTETVNDRFNHKDRQKTKSATSLSHTTLTVPVQNKFELLATHQVDVDQTDTIIEDKNPIDNKNLISGPKDDIGVKKSKDLSAQLNLAARHNVDKPAHRMKNKKTANASINKSNNDSEKNQIGRHVKLTPNSSKLIKNNGGCLSLKNFDVQLDKVTSQDTDDMTVQCERIQAWAKKQILLGTW